MTRAMTSLDVPPERKSFRRRQAERGEGPMLMAKPNPHRSVAVPDAQMRVSSALNESSLSHSRLQAAHANGHQLELGTKTGSGQYRQEVVKLYRNATAQTLLPARPKRVHLLLDPTPRSETSPPKRPVSNKGTSTRHNHCPQQELLRLPAVEEPRNSAQIDHTVPVSHDLLKSANCKERLPSLYESSHPTKAANIAAVHHKTGDKDSKKKFAAARQAAARASRRVCKALLLPSHQRQPPAAKDSASGAVKHHSSTDKKAAIEISSSCNGGVSHAKKVEHSIVPGGMADRALDDWLRCLQDNPACDWIRENERNVRRSLWHRGSPELLMLGERHGIDLSLVEGLEQFRLDLHTSWWSRMRWSGYMLPEDAADASYEWIKTIWTVLNEFSPSDRTLYIVCGVGKQANHDCVCCILADLKREGVVAAWRPRNRNDNGCIAVHINELE